MKLVCFANQTGGGLMCDLLNKEESSRYNKYHITSATHGMFKTGDTGGVHRIFDEAAWLKSLDKLNEKLSKNQIPSDAMYFGTHCHPSCIPEKYLSMFDEIIAITTETTNSKLLRFVRIYNGIIKILGGSWDGPPDGYTIQDDSFYFTEKVDEIKARCYLSLDEFESNSNCTNIEFEDIINGKFVNDNQLNNNIFNTWKEKNSFMYQPIDPFLLNMFSKTSEERTIYKELEAKKLTGVQDV
jgi:hypothetical protein